MEREKKGKRTMVGRLRVFFWLGGGNLVGQ